MLKVFIEVGHGGTDSGAVYGNLIEKTMNLVTAQSTAKALRRCGFEVKLSRETDIFVGINAAAVAANEFGADIVLSQHYNAGGADRGEVIHAVQYGKGTELATKIAEEIKAIGQTKMQEYSKANSVGNDYFGIIRLTNAPAVIIEPCFIDNEVDRRLADTEDEQQAVGVAVAKAVCKYFNVTYVPDAAPIISPNDIAWEYGHLGIVTDVAGFKAEMEANPNGKLYWVSKKALDYIHSIKK